MTVNFNANMEIVGLNETQIQVLTSYSMSTPFGATDEHDYDLGKQGKHDIPTGGLTFE